MKRPRLKDFRRLVGRGAAIVETRPGVWLDLRLKPPTPGGEWMVSEVIQLPFPVEDRVLNERELDRLIGFLGPDYSGLKDLDSPPESRPKGTDRVEPDAVPGSDTAHGGDGSSGEVDSPSEKGGQDAPGDTGAGNPGQGSSGSRPDSGAETPSPGAATGGAGDGFGTTGSLSGESGGRDVPEAADCGDPVPAGGQDSTGSSEPAEVPDDERASSTEAVSSSADNPREFSGDSPRADEETEDLGKVHGHKGRRQDGESLPAKREQSRTPSGAAQLATPEGVRDLLRRSKKMPAADTATLDKLLKDGYTEEWWSCELERRLQALTEAQSAKGCAGETGGTGLTGGTAYAPHSAQELLRMAQTLSRSVAARRLRKALERFLDRQVGPVGDPTPRIDGKRLVRELASRSVRLSRCRRREFEPSTAILAVDISGSCAVVSPETTAAAFSVAARDPRLVYVEHANGDPFRVVTSAGDRKVDLGYSLEEAGWWVELCKEHNTTTIIWLGDADGNNIRRSLHEEHGLQILLLDNFAASWGKVYPASKDRQEPWCFAHVVGVSDARTIVQGLKVAQTRR